MNGIIDAVVATSGTSELNDGPLYIGNTPWHEEDCVMNYLIDDFKFFNRELTEIEVEAESAGSLGHIEPFYIRLGCINCDLETA